MNLFFGQSYQPVTSNTACDSIIASNLSNFGKPVCQGKYGYFVVGTGVTNTGSDHQSAQAFYIQDQWQVTRHLTLNLGLRLDQETQPPFDPTRFPTVHFGWGDKIGPRLGGAYDLLHNGKVKVYASYGQFYDIMKLGLARGSFGSDYWHNCVYAMDDTDYTKITPSYPAGGGCPATGPAPGVNVGRFIENVDFRATKADPRDPAISPSMKPMKQHEFVTGAEWAVKPNWSLTFRYSRKRIDNTIEDMSITDNLGFYIGNPGYDLRRPAAPAGGHPGRQRQQLSDQRAVLRGVPAGGSGNPPLRWSRVPAIQESDRPLVWIGVLHLQQTAGQLSRLDEHRSDRWNVRPPRPQQQPPVRPADHDLFA